MNTYAYTCTSTHTTTRLRHARLRAYLHVYEQYTYVYTCTSTHHTTSTTCTPTCIFARLLTMHVYTLPQLIDFHGLHAIVGDVVMKFMKRKPSPFKGALVSKTSVMRSPSWKRAMVFVFVVRHMLGLPSQKMWTKFSYTDYKTNVRCFKRWIKMDQVVMKKSKKFLKLPDDDPRYGSPTKSKKSRKLKRSNSRYSLSSDSPMKRRCVLDSSTTDED